VTRMIHGEDGLATALKVTESAAPGSKAVLDAEVFKEISQDMPSTDLNFAEVVGQKYTDVAARIGLSSSKTEALRLIQNAGAYLNNEKVDDPQFRIQEDLLIGGEYLLFGSGKKKKILVKVQK
ncbi:MAG: S4 domain-containing protein, partial [Parachlamydiales bacterium]